MPAAALGKARSILPGRGPRGRLAPLSPRQAFTVTAQLNGGN
jgi:hypothetical protein